MATHDYVIDNSTGANVRADINNALAAIVSNNSNSSEPATKYAYQWWADTSNNILKIRNSANNAWIELLQLDGTLTLEDGSASTPALAFRDDLDTGVFSSAANTFNIAAGGTERLKVDSDGRVHINTANLTDALKIDFGGGFVLQLDGAGNISQFRGDGSTGGLVIDTAITSGSFGSGGGFISFKPKGSEAVLISGDGNLGIGESSPAYSLDVKNNSTTAYSDSASPSNIIARLRNGSSQTNSHASLLLTATNDNGAVDFWWMTIVSQSTNYDGFLAFSARTTSSSSQELIRFANNGRVSMQVLGLGSGNSHASAKLVIQGAGNTSATNSIFVKNSDETELFSLRNDGVFYTGVDGASPYNLTTSNAANVFISSSGALFRSTSSVRYKKDIVDATFGLADVLKLKPKTFKSNATGEFADDKTYAGFTAEDIHDLGLTEFVQYNEDNEPDALDYGNMVALMAKAIQELNTKVAALEAA